IAKEGYNPTYGARPLRRAIQRMLEDNMAEQVLQGNFKEGDVIETVLEGDTVKFQKLAKKVAKPEKGEKEEKGEKSEKAEKAEKPEKASSKGDKGDKSHEKETGEETTTSR
ncbi:MAG TPA: hypothetical protein PLC15_16790, partial [Candidatus Obscuribacter sp.]|nr:hypothetical protein [Candidatus Obscuribacter sp.]